MKQTAYLGRVKCSTHSIEELLLSIKSMLDDRDSSPNTISYINAHVYNLAVSNKELRGYVNGMRIVTADGMAIVWAARFLGIHMAERCNMTEAFRAYLQSEGMPPARAVLLGCTDEDLQLASKAIAKQSTHCRIVQCLNGFHSVEDYRRLLSDVGEVDFVFIGAGTPRSEQLMAHISEWYPRLILWHIGGGTIRMLAGSMVEAPLWMRKTGLQWLHRLISDPGTMWRRYLVGNPLFVWHILFLKLRGGPSDG
jgi:exopolysaccharide biosynthesis WecB/TagA/CpsF family protein